MPHIVDFRKPESLDEAALFLGIDIALLELAIAAGQTPANSPQVYVRHQIPKKNKQGGEYREVWDVVDPGIRDAHRAFARRFADFVADVEPDFPHPSAYGYVRGRGIKDNAKRHCGHSVLLRCDIANFFGSITSARISSRLIQLGIQANIAEILASFSSIENKLALGLNASPLLANLVCLELDKKIQEYATRNDLTYTRYADDIAISGNLCPDYDQIVDIVEGEGFHLSRKKTRVTKLGQAHFVTGLSVTDSAGPHVPRQYKRRLRQELYYCKKYGIRGHLQRVDERTYQRGVNRIDGTVRFVASIEKTLAPRIREQWRELLIADSASVSYAPQHNKAGIDATILVDESVFMCEGKRYLALACVTTQQISLLRTAASALLREYVVDPFSVGRKDKLQKKGLHYSDAPEELRSRLTAFLPYLPFRAYIAFGSMSENDDYVALYFSLLNSVLPRRLMSYDRARLTLIFEENPRIVKGSLRQSVKTAYRTLEQSNNRRPLTTPNILICSKESESAVSVADAVLGIFGQYFVSGHNSNNAQLRFERLRDKYRHISNIDTGDVFSRRHPIEVSGIRKA